jgi:hypothetical protein
MRLEKFSQGVVRRVVDGRVVDGRVVDGRVVGAWPRIPRG